MRTRTRSSLALVVGIALMYAVISAPGMALAEEAAGKGSFSSALASRYVWRGQVAALPRTAAGAIDRPKVKEAHGQAAAAQ